MASVNQILGRIREFWSKVTPPVRWLSVGLAASLFIALGVVLWLNQPKWVTLVPDLSPQEASAVATKLDELKVQHKETGDAKITIAVKETEKYTARLALGSANLPKSSTFTLDWFTDPKFAATDADRRINEMRGRAGEMEQALTRMSDVEAAVVKLNPPQQSAFVREKVPGSAAVIITTRAGRTLDKKQVWAIIKTVSGGLGIPDNQVSVVDQFGRQISRGVVELFANADYNPDDVDKESKKAQELELKLRQVFEPMFGPGNVAASVYVSINHTSEKVNSTTVTPGAPGSKSTSSEGSQGSPGTTTTTDPTRPQQPGNPPTYQGATPGPNGTAFKNTDSTTFQNGQTTTERYTPGGDIQKISVGLTLNSKDLTAAQKLDIQKLAANSVGALENDVSVLAMAFPATVVAAAPPSVPKVIPPTMLSLILAATAIGLLAIFFMMRRRPMTAMSASLPEAEPLLADLPSLAGLPSGLDVALGLEGVGGMPGAMPGGFPGMPGGMPGAAQGFPGAAQGGGFPGMPGDAGAAVPSPFSVTDEPDGPRTPIMQSPRQRFEFIMASRPKRQVVLEGTPVDEELLALIDDLIDGNATGCAEIIRQWMKEGKA